MSGFSTFTYAKKYFVSPDIEFVTEPDLEFGETYKPPQDLINLLADNLIVYEKVGIGTTNPLQKLHVSNGPIRIGNVFDYGTGVSGIGLTNAQLSGTSEFKPKSFTGTRITTSSGVGTVTSISNILLGPVGIASTTPTSSNNDDGYWTLTVPFDVQFTGITTNTIYVGTNSYITFTGGSTEYSNNSFSNPNLPKIMISVTDRYGIKIYTNTTGTTPNRTYWVRYEGSTYWDSSSGPPGPTNMIWEATFYENAPSQIDIQVGQNAGYIDIDNTQTKLQLEGPIGFNYGNILIGDKSTGASLTPENTSVGILGYDPYGTNNIFLGAGVGSSTTTGYNNFFAGIRAGYANTSGSSNNFLGKEVAIRNTTGSYNNFFGYGVATGNTTGSNNNFFGAYTGYNNTTGNDNNLFGRGAGANLTTGNNNTIIGRIAGTAGLSDTVIIGAGTTERLRIDSSGYLRMAASTGGIQFNGDTAAANALEDYEEGTFVPVVKGTSTPGTAMYDIQEGRYTKIGNKVFFEIEILWNSGTGTGILIIDGLPFTTPTNMYGSATVGYVYNLALTAGHYLMIDIGPTLPKLYCAQYPTGGGTPAGVAYDASASLEIAGFYTVP